MEGVIRVRSNLSLVFMIEVASQIDLHRLIGGCYVTLIILVNGLTLSVNVT